MLTSTMLADLVTTAFEGGSTYWIERAERISLHTTSIQPWYADPDFYTTPWSCLIKVDEEAEPYQFDQTTAREAWDHLNADFPDRAEAIRTETYDADDADVFMQLALFHDVVYG